jgi:aminopeptidase N
MGLILSDAAKKGDSSGISEELSGCKSSPGLPGARHDPDRASHYPLSTVTQAATQTLATAKEIRRLDYRPPDFWIERVDLTFVLDADHTRVRARLSGRRNEAVNPGRRPLVLAGEDLELHALRLNGSDLVIGEFEVTDEGLVVPEVTDRFELATEVELHPRANTQLSGLYLSNGIFCTQCEAEGFRRITYFLDRPDVMARYSVRIEAERARCPVLLSNGNRVESGALPGGRHFVRYEDPFKKPSYLFALVAGDLACQRGTFQTRSGRTVALEIWVEPQNREKCAHALRSLQRAMKWDEEVFGLEYDLDVYQIVAVNDFNMGAMENKGLNVFNSKFVLADVESATDDDYQAIEGVIGHEYFHNWTGNRVTCRDWFQLTLKEGLTVFRDQQFSADMGSAAVKRIDDVRKLRVAQFAEDAGPMAHSIRPESYVSMDNFYTATVYEKGAEVVRLYHALFGQAGFRRGMDLYFERHDGSAVTCDDFRAALADANGADLAQFERWYTQRGTPVLEARGAYDPSARIYDLTLKQLPPANAVEPHEPLHVPVRVGLIGPDGRDLPLRLQGEYKDKTATTRLFELKNREQTLRFVDVPVAPVPSVLRGFSAPVKLRMARPRAELAFLLAHDSDPFNRWDAGQELAKQVLIELVGLQTRGEPLSFDPAASAAFGRLLADESLDGSFRALALTLPDELVLGQEFEVLDPEAVHSTRRFALRALALAHREAFLALYRRLAADLSGTDAAAIDRRRLKNRALAYLATLEQPETITLAFEQFERARNMTDAEAALAALVGIDCRERELALEAFYRRWKHDPLVLDKWFRLQALAPQPATFERVVALAAHPDFTLKNPNRVRALLGAFAHGNQARFHGKDGRAYAFFTEKVLALDELNPQLAARMASAFNSWRRFEPTRRAAMHAELERIAARAKLSKDTSEIVTRALGAS